MLNAEDAGFFSVSAGFENEKNDVEAALDDAVGVLGAANEKPPAGFGASDFGVEAGVVDAPKEKPVAGAADVGVVIGAADVELALPKEKDGAGAVEVAMDTALVAALVLPEARPPNGEPAPKPDLFNNELCEF